MHPLAEAVPVLPEMDDDAEESLAPQGSATRLRSVPSAEHLQALVNMSPALRGATSLAVPGARPQVGLPSIRRRASPRTSGSGGYSPRQRVILATLPAEQPDDASCDVEGFKLGSSAATSPTPSPDAKKPGPDAKPAPDASWQQYVVGTAPALSAAVEHRPWVDFWNCTLRGFGQVMFMNNPMTGLLVVLALLWQSLYVGTLGLVGALAATGTAQLLEIDAGARRSGLLTFNGVLVGLALGTFDRGCTDAATECSLGDWAYFPALLLPVALFAAVSVIFSVSLGNLLAQVWGVAAFTLPFNVAALLFLGTALQSGRFPQQALAPSFLQMNASITDENVDWMQVLEAIPKGESNPSN